MWSLITSFGTWLFNLFFRTSVVKFVVFTAIYLVLAVLIAFLNDVLDLEGYNAQSALDGLGSEILYFLGVFRFDLGIPIIIGALVTRFVIRRIPVIG